MTIGREIQPLRWIWGREDNFDLVANCMADLSFGLNKLCSHWFKKKYYNNMQEYGMGKEKQGINSFIGVSINPPLKIGWCQASKKKPSSLNSKWALKLERGKEWGKENLQLPILLTGFHLAKYLALSHGHLGVLRENIRKRILFSAASIYSFKFFICKVCIRDVIFNTTSALCPSWICIISFWTCFYFDIHKTVSANSKIQFSVFLKSTLIGFKPVDKMNSACFSLKKNK